MLCDSNLVASITSASFLWDQSLQSLVSLSSLSLLSVVRETETPIFAAFFLFGKMGGWAGPAR